MFRFTNRNQKLLVSDHNPPNPEPEVSASFEANAEIKQSKDISLISMRGTSGRFRPGLE